MAPMELASRHQLRIPTPTPSRPDTTPTTAPAGRPTPVRAAAAAYVPPPAAAIVRPLTRAFVEHEFKASCGPNQYMPVNAFAPLHARSTYCARAEASCESCLPSLVELLARMPPEITNDAAYWSIEYPLAPRLSARSTLKTGTVRCSVAFRRALRFADAAAADSGAWYVAAFAGVTMPSVSAAAAQVGAEAIRDSSSSPSPSILLSGAEGRGRPAQNGIPRDGRESSPHFRGPSNIP